MKCKFCAEEIQKEAKICPHCKKQVGTSTAAKVVMGVVWVFLGLGFYFIMTVVLNDPSQPVATTSAPAPAVPQVEPLELVEFEWARGEFGNRILVGTVKNNSSK